MSKSATTSPTQKIPSIVSETTPHVSEQKSGKIKQADKNGASAFEHVSAKAFPKDKSDELGLITAIDVGTNSFHAIVASVNEEGVFTIHSRAKENVRLGESVSDMKYLSDEAMKRGIEAMKRFSMMAEAANAPIRAIGTSAMREALNRDEFVRRVQEETGVAIEVISGNEEARLIYLGVLQALPILNSKTLVIDVGGGSTETIVGYRGEMLYGHSAKLGAIRLTRRFFGDDKVTPKALKECREFIRGEWALVFRSIQVCGFERVVISSGTAQTLASVALAKKNRYNPDESLNGVRITKAEALEAIELILKEKTSKKRAELPGMDPKRADIIVGGVLILEQAITRLGIQEITISDHALREGILFDHYQKQFNIERYHHLSQLRYKSVQNLCDTCQVDLNHAEHVRFLAIQLFDALRVAEMHFLGESERELLEAASLLHDVGYHISADQHHKHSYYIIRNTPLLGFTNDEEELIANIARYHRKSHPKAKHENFERVPPEKRFLVSILAGILRIAEGLDRRRQRLINTIALELQGHTLRIKLSCRVCEDTPDIELWSATRRVGLLEEVLEKKIVLEVLPNPASESDKQLQI